MRISDVVRLGEGDQHCAQGTTRRGGHTECARQTWRGTKAPKRRNMARKRPKRSGDGEDDERQAMRTCARTSSAHVRVDARQAEHLELGSPNAAAMAGQSSKSIIDTLLNPT